MDAEIGNGSKHYNVGDVVVFSNIKYSISGYAIVSCEIPAVEHSKDTRITSIGRNFKFVIAEMEGYAIVSCEIPAVEHSKDTRITSIGRNFKFVIAEMEGNAWPKIKGGFRQNELRVLNNVCGALRPGRLTFILGPSGAGKTSLLRILAGRKKRGVKGSIQGVGSNAVLVAQHATLIDALTVRETLHFAGALKLSRTTSFDRTETIERISCQLGIREVFNTRTSRLSGGERKRLTIACELLTDPHIMLLDEPTSGLDSVSSMSVVKAIQAVARTGRTVACVVHQPSSQLFTLADDVILLAEGRTLYAGTITDVPDVLKKAGLTCPQYYNIADYLIEIASNKHVKGQAILENEAKLYVMEMRKIADPLRMEQNLDISNEADILLNVNTPYVTNYTASYIQQLKALLWRGYIGALRDVHLTQIRLVTHLLVALLLGALYNGAGEEAHRMTTNTSCLFFFLLFLFFSNAMPTIQSFPVESTVVLQEHLNKWYSLTMYCVSKILVDLPVQLLCATVFVFPAWYLTSQPLEFHRMGLAWVICALTTILAQTFGLVIGAACGVKLGMFVIPAVNIPMLMFSGFFIPYDEMPDYLRPFATISYFRYAFDGFLLTVYGFERPSLTCHKTYCFFRHPVQYLNHLGLSQNFNNDIIILITWIIALEISLICVLRYKVYKACK